MKVFLSRNVVLIVEDGVRARPNRSAMQAWVRDLEARYPGKLREVRVYRHDGFFGSAGGGKILLSDSIFRKAGPADQKGTFYHEYGHLVCDAANPKGGKAMSDAYLDIALSAHDDAISRAISPRQYMPKSVFPVARGSGPELCADAVAVHALYPKEFCAWLVQAPPELQGLMNKFLTAIPLDRRCAQ